MNSYAGKTVWIIGASSGIGHALAHTLHARGAILILSARNENTLHTLNIDLGGRHKVLAFDVQDQAAFAQAFAQLGKIDSALYLAAAYSPAKIVEITSEDCAHAVATNLSGAFTLLRYLLPHYKAQGYGQIALCGSVAGYKGLPQGQPYSATKAAIINLAESLRAEVAGDNIDVKLISPGFVKTPLTDKNDFAMPMIILPGEAARAIADGLLTKKFEIAFPFMFTALMKMIRALPYVLYFALARKMNR